MYWIDGPWKGRIGIVPRPRGGDWLEDDVRMWQKIGLVRVISLLTPDEVSDLALSEEEALCQTHGIQFTSFPIVDRGVPVSRNAVLSLVSQLESALEAGALIAVHCRQGIGRSALLVACVLVVATGHDPNTVFQVIGIARGCAVPETVEQRDWVTRIQPLRVS